LLSIHALLVKRYPCFYFGRGTLYLGIKVKIVFVANRYPPHVTGGAEISVSIIANELVRLGNCVKIITLSDSRRSGFYSDNDVEVTSIPNFNLYNQFAGKRGVFSKAIFSLLDIFNPLVFMYFLKWLLRNRPDVVSTHNLKGIGCAIWVACKVLRIPVSFTAHDYWLICPATTMYKNDKCCEKQCISCKILSKPKAWLANTCITSFFGVSRYVVSKHHDYGLFNDTKSIVAHNSRPLAISSNEQRGDRTNEDSVFCVGYIGKIDKTKGIECVFKAVNLLGGDIQLHVAGKDSNNLVAALSAKYPSVNSVAHGFVRSNEFFNYVDVIIVPSVWEEPFGNVAYEGWGFGVPSIVFRSGGLPEIMSGMEEMIVEKNDVEAVAKLINKLMVDKVFASNVKNRCKVNRLNFVPEVQGKIFQTEFSMIVNHNQEKNIADE